MMMACLQGSEYSAKWSFMQAWIRPPPGCNPAQCCWISAPQAWRTAACCAMPLAGARRSMEAKANLVVLCTSILRPSLFGYPGLAQAEEVSRLGQGADFGFVIPD